MGKLVVWQECREALHVRVKCIVQDVEHSDVGGKILKVARLDFLGAIPPKFEH